MKTVLNRIALLTMLAVPLTGMAQKKGDITWPSMPIDKDSEKITYTAVNEVAETSATDLYDRALDWATSYHKNAAEKLRVQDRDGGKMELFVRFPFYAYDKKGNKTSSRQGLAQYTMTILFKEGRYKYTVTDLNMKATSYQPIEPWLDPEDPNATNHAFYLTDIDQEIRAMLSNMKEAVATDPNEQKDDW